MKNRMAYDIVRHSAFLIFWKKLILFNKGCDFLWYLHMWVQTTIINANNI